MVSPVCKRFRCRLATVVEIEKKQVGRNIEHVDVGDVNVLHHASTATVALEAQSYVGTQELTVAY